MEANQESKFDWNEGVGHSKPFDFHSFKRKVLHILINLWIMSYLNLGLVLLWEYFVKGDVGLIPPQHDVEYLILFLAPMFYLFFLFWFFCGIVSGVFAFLGALFGLVEFTFVDATWWTIALSYLVVNYYAWCSFYRYLGKHFKEKLSENAPEKARTISLND